MMEEHAAPQTRVMKIDALPAVPWKNGGGVTRNLAIEPEAAGLDDFSLAAVPAGPSGSSTEPAVTHTPGVEPCEFS